MSEYWKSTPKYWCKHCKVYVRDTKLERQNHDATPRHQGNLKRFLRDLHRGHENEAKEKERAKAEVARLKGESSGAGNGEGSSTSKTAFGRVPPPAPPQPQATPSERKQQLAQLAEMGVSIPEEFRGEMAMAGEWQVTSERIIDPENEGEKKPEALVFGVRKRTNRGDEEDEEPHEPKKRKWGSSYRTYPGHGEDEDDLDALLSNSAVKGKLVESEVKQEPADSANGIVKKEKEDSIAAVSEVPAVKKEPSDEAAMISDQTTSTQQPMEELNGEPSTAGVVFKKRKAKNIRQK